MGNRLNRHIPAKDYSRDCGHEFYYKRKERTDLPNAVKPRKSPGMRRFVILFVDLILAIGGVTIIRSCIANRDKESKAYPHSGANAASLLYAATTTIEKGAGVHEYRLTIRKKDRSMFKLNTNQISVRIALNVSGEKSILQARRLTPD